jgi:acyl carrier protein
MSDIYDRIVPIMADVLAVDEEEVRPEASLVKDLGAESIDMLDLVFRLEREFKVKIPRGQLEKEARQGLTDEEFESRGVVTDKGLAVLRQYFTEVPAERLQPGLKVAEIPALFTVETFCKVVQRALDNQQTVSS